MDNITPLVPGTKKSSCVITLDPFQYAFYQQSCIEIQNPDDDFLEFIGKPIQQEVETEELLQLREKFFSCNLCFLKSKKK